MKILLSIKSILNYLYNNLIDLVWTSKIRFSDGTEMTTVPKGNKLYDIKLLSQAIANNGFAFMCHDTKKFISKTDVPTVYNDIKNKYDNCDSVLSSYSQLSEQVYNVFVKGDYLYIIDTNRNLKKCLISDLDNPIWTTLYTFTNQNLNVNKSSLCVGDNFIVITSAINGITIYVFDLNGNLIDNVSYPTVNIQPDNAISYMDNSFYLSFAKKIDNNDSFITEKIEDISTYNRSEINQNSIGCLYCIQKLNSKLFFIANNQLYKSDLNFNNITLCISSSNIEFGTIVIIGNTILTSRMANGKALISTDGGQTFTETAYNSQNSLLGIALVGDYAYGIKPNTTNIYKSQDLINWSSVTEMTASSNIGSSRSVTFCGNNKVFVGRFVNTVRYCADTKIVYTDTLVVNGSNVNVNYYKNNDWKICVSDGGINDNNIDTFFDFQGYENYYLLDLANEQIALPHNNNKFSVMFVDDDYIDTDIPNGNFHNVITVSEEIIIDSASVSIDIKPNKNYTLNNANITDITLSSNVFSSLETTIDIVTGATAPTLTDNANIDWVDGSAPVLNANSSYLILIWKNKGFVKEY